MKNKIVIAILALCMLMACSEQLDINENPLSATKADPNTVLPYVFVQYSNRKITEVGTRMADVWQNTAISSNSPANGGANAGGFLSSNMWGMYFTAALSNLKQLENEGVAGGEAFTNVVAISKIFQSQIFYEMTSAWEDIPFSEALNATEFPNPSFDSQENVLRGLVTDLDEAMALIDGAPTSGMLNVSRGDLIYGGNLTKWRAYANSLKIRILMMIRNVDSTVDPTLLAALQEPYITSNADCPMIRYAGSAGAINGYKNLVIAFGNGSNIGTDEYGPSEVLVSLLTGDPRLELWILDGTNGNYETQPIGQYPDETTARMNDNLIRGNLPDLLFQPAEITFYRAELAALGVTTEDEDALFKQGVDESVRLWGQDIPGLEMSLSNSTIDDFVNGLTISGLTQGEQLQRIYEQTYLTHFWWPFESWNTVRRTGVPTLDPVPGSVIATMLKRLAYPSTELAANPNTPVQPLLDTPMWFENIN